MKRITMGFTLLEMLIVISVIAILLSITMASYSTVQRNARDARRKADLEQVRAALEQYKSVNNYYPGPDTASLSVLTGSYIGAIPLAPDGVQYVYTAKASGGGACTTAGLNCVTYTLSTTLEGGTSYSVTPYGVL